MNSPSKGRTVMMQFDRPVSWAVLTLAIAASAVFAGSLAADELPEVAERPRASSEAAGFQVPDASPSELLAFIRKAKARYVEGNSRDERIAFAVRRQTAICIAADRILAFCPADDVETVAVSEKFAALWALIKLDDPRAGHQAARMARKFADDSRSELAGRARFFLLWERAQRLAKTSKESSESEAAALVDDVGRQLESGNHDRLLVTLASTLPEQLQQSRPKLARRGARRFALALSKSTDPIATRAAKHLRSVARRLSIVGQPAVISGHVFGRGEVGAGKFRGHVVLVEYWATWCAPCIAEIPAIRSTYEKYRDRGFEVVAVSLDEDRDQLAKFLDENPVPWTVLCGRSSDDSAMRQPMVVDYAIDTAGRNFLVDRQGRIVALDVRGDHLQEILERLLVEASDATDRND